MESLQIGNLWLLFGAALVLVGIASSLLARRFGAPLLLVFLFLGMLLGEDGPGGLVWDNYELTYLVGSLALAVILFDGGLRTRLREVRSSLAPAGLLATVGVLITAGLTGLAAIPLLGLGWVEGMLLGAIIASTDAAAVFFLLRAGGLHLQRRVSSTLEVESGSNDPIAVFLTVVLTGWLAADGAHTLGDFGWRLLSQAGFGVTMGLAGGWLLALALNRLALPDGLHPLLAVSGAILVFALTNQVGGSGFLAVYLAGLMVGNRPVRAFASVVSVQDAATWLAQLVMFLVLGLLATPSQLIEVMWPALGLAAFLMLVARPAAVALCLWPFAYPRREVAFISWVGLRGAVGIFLASIPMLAQLPNAGVYFNVAFVVVIVSLVVQGWTLKPAAEWFRVALPRLDPPTRRVELDLPGQLELEMVGYRVAPESAVLRGAQLPGWARPAMVVREGKVLQGSDGGALQPEDYAYYLAPPGSVYRLDWLFAEPREARELEREVFGAFTLAGDVPLGELASFYGLEIPERYADQTAAQLFAHRFDDLPQIGDVLKLGEATLVVRSIEEEQVGQVGLKFAPVPRLLGKKRGGVSARLRSLWRRRGRD
ncbi:potassium/proton antiporter [Alkalisalibacterium limincola]|uniref:Potassium/proton antiporter n=1 Tax=Alkalisalibacterium limincola TaxID=2699169 RepID=A0A5C8KND3_9GAMM|nr:potassium/proton antiporter [Alkalisalibacterium limincola]TXK60786.1 potassium/proton antiporter [Alkalisalibacterium limincola]